MLNIIEQKLLNHPYKRSTTMSKKDKHKKGEFVGENPSNIDITSEFGIHKTENSGETKPSSMQEFLDSHSNKSTRRMYRRGIELFCQWHSKDVETILKERKDDLTPRPNESFVETKQRASRYEKLLEKFHGWLLKQGYKINTARTLCLACMHGILSVLVLFLAISQVFLAYQWRKKKNDIVALGKRRLTHRKIGLTTLILGYISS